METTTMTEKEYVCKFCNKKCPSGKSLGGHIRIHTNQYSLYSSSYNSKKNNKKRMVEDQREITALKQQLCCRECGKGFDSLKALWNHMDCCNCEGEKLVMDTQSDTETSSSSSSPTRKRSKKQQSSSESFSNGSLSSSFDQEHKNTALSLMMLSMDSRGLTLVVADSSVYNSEILDTKVSSGEKLKMIFNVADDDGAILSVDDSYSSDSDYFMNGPKRSDSDISVDGCLRNNGDDDDLVEAKEGRSKYELRKSKRVALPCYETDSCADTNIKIHSKKAVSGGANKNSKKGHECPICFRVFKSGQALGGHKRSHFIGNHEHRIKHREAAADMRIDLNLPAAAQEDI